MITLGGYANSMAITQLLNNQSINFDDHMRTKAISKLKDLHFHKRMNSNNKKYPRAEVKIYLDGRTEWDCRGKNSDKLEKELHQVFDGMSVEERIKFVYDVGEEVDRFFNGKPTLEEKIEIRNNIVRAFYGPSLKNEAIISSSNFKKIYFSDVSEIKVKIDGKKYRVSFYEKNGKKSITITDVTDDKK